MMRPMNQQMILLSQAARILQQREVSPYFELRSLILKQDRKSRAAFKRIFSTYYGLNAAGLTDAFKKRYFDLLFGLDLSIHEAPPYETVLKALYKIKRRKKDRALQASFVSKLISIHDESHPLFDRHVSGFFGISVPTSGALDFRISGFVENLDHIRNQYREWCENEQVKELIAELKLRIPQLTNCHAIRICDFLVWTIGRHKIGSPSK